MVAYVVVIRDRTIDPAQGAIYTPMAKAASASHAMTIRALHGRHAVREGPPMEAVSILEFPSYEEAVAWYDSPAYQEALPYRLKGGDYRAVIIDGV